MSHQDRLEDMLRRADAAAQPQLSEAALREAFGTDADQWPLRRGVVWRARWDNTALLVLVVRVVSSTVVDCVPITLDDDGVADEDTLVVETTGRLQHPAVVWRDLFGQLSLAVLDRPIAELEPEVASWAAGGHVVPAGARLAEPSHPFRGGSYQRAATSTAMEELTSAKLPSAAPVLGPRTESVKPTREQLLALSQRLAQPLADVLQLIDGKRSVTRDEAAALQEILGVVPEVPGPPTGLIAEMSHPRWKRTVLDLVQRDDLNETVARSSMSTGTLAMAARQTGDKEPDWRARLASWATANQLAHP